MGTPARVLLVGDCWDPLERALTSLAGRGDLLFIGPYSAGFVSGNDEAGLSVVLVGPGGALPDPQPATGTDGADGGSPAVLLCIGHDALEDDDLYHNADDFVLVPCTPAELEKRIRRLAFRKAEAQQSLRLKVGKIVLDLATYQVFLEGERVDLAWLEYQLLRFLMENLGRIFTREQLLAHVWGVEGFSGTRTVDVHIRRLRNKLEVNGDEYFRTVKNVGYGMVKPV